MIRATVTRHVLVALIGTLSLAACSEQGAPTAPTHRDGAVHDGSAPSLAKQKPGGGTGTTTFGARAMGRVWVSSGAPTLDPATKNALAVRRQGTPGIYCIQLSTSISQGADVVAQLSAVNVFETEASQSTVHCNADELGVMISTLGAPNDHVSFNFIVM